MPEVRNICALIIFSILLCNFTISLLYAAWKGLCRIFDACSLTGLNYHYIHILYIMAGIFLFLAGLRNYRYFMPKYNLYKSFYNILISYSPIRLLFMIWIIGVLISTALHIRSRFITCHHVLNASTMIKYDFRNLLMIKVSCLINLKIIPELYENDYLHTPVTTGLFHPRIILPTSEFTQKDLDIFLLHETLHIKQHDVFWIALAALIRILFWFNPVVYYLEKNLRLVTEYYCDEKSCRYGLNKFTIQQYFHSIFLLGRPKKTFYKGGIVMLKDPTTDIENRAANLMKRKRNQAFHSALFILFLSISLLCSSLSARAACYLADTAEDYFLPEVAKTIPYSPNPISYTARTAALNDSFLSNMQVLTDYFPERRFDGIIDYQCSIAPGEKYITPSYSMSSGDVISISGSFVPSDQTIEVGILRVSDLNAEIISFTRFISYNYTITTAGDYQVYLYNPGNQTVDTTGTIEFIR